jgi:DNA-binding LacI/PurR family transcriptional regulator
MTGSPSIYDVSREAGVSLGTVSRVLNNSPSVGETTRERVEATIARLGYRPHPGARSLASGSTRSLAVLVPELSNPLFGEIAAAAQEAADAHEHTVLVYGTSGDPDRERRYIESMLEHRVDSLLLVRSSLARDELEVLTESMTIVEIGLGRQFPRSRVVGVDEVKGARTAVEHLLDLGHTRIALIRGTDGDSGAADRARGFHDALAARGLRPSDELIATAPFGEQGGADAMNAILDRAPEPPTAVFASTDLMALGAMSALMRRGHRIPDDISLVGYDDIRISEHLPVPLTTVRVPAIDLGREAVRLAIDGEDAETVTLPSEIVIRRSAARPSRERNPA